jgi:helicase associated protein
MGIFEEQFEKGFQETVIYKKNMGNPNAPCNYKTVEGYSLGPWQNYQRWLHKNGKLSPDRIKRLRKIGFTWRKREELFKKGFRATVLYKKIMGNPNAPQHYKTPEGYPLGQWQTRQRDLFKNKKLSPGRIKRLEEIGFKWNKREERFERGFQETVLYKKSMGNPNGHFGYKTPEGYPLGSWQSHQREFYKNGKLSPDRIKRLEEIGFKWRLRR